MDKIFDEGKNQIKRCLRSGVDKEVNEYAERLAKHIRTAFKIETSPASWIRIPLAHLRRLNQGKTTETDFESEIGSLKAEFFYAAYQTKEKGLQGLVALINFGVEELLNNQRQVQGIRNLTQFLEAIMAYHYAAQYFE